MFDRIVGMELGWRKHEYTWRDMALYALACGADANDLMYTYEKNMKALPSYAAVPYYGAVNVTPDIPRPYPLNYKVVDEMSRELGREVKIAPHLGFQIEMKRPIDPIKGSLVYNSVVDKLYDRGRDVDLEIRSDIYDEAANLLAVTTSYHRVRGVGGFGGTPPVKKVVTFPDREPDVTVQSYISKTQNALYRLTGDTNLSHIDPEVARDVAGDRGPFMQGLSSLGFATRMMIKAMIPGEPERMTRIYVQMRHLVFPGTPVEVRAWKTGEHSAVFKYINLTDETAILDNCEFEWK